MNEYEIKNGNSRIGMEVGRGFSRPSTRRGTVPRLRRTVVLLVALLLAMSATPQLASAAVGSAVPISEQFAVVEADGDQYSPDTDGDWVVWEDYRKGFDNADIWAYDLKTEQEFQITTASGDQINPKVSEKWVVWEDYRNGNADVYAYDLENKIEKEIATGDADQRYPAIDGDTVVWQDDRNGRWDIFGYDLLLGQEREVSTAAADQRYPAIDGDTVVWQDNRKGTGTSDIYGKKLSGGQEFAVNTATSYKDQPSVSGSIVAWRQQNSGNSDIYAKDLKSGKVSQITSNAADQASPAINGKVVVWADWRSGNSDIYANNLATGNEFQVATGASPQEGPALSGKAAVWETQKVSGIGFGTWDVQGANMDTVAPSAPVITSPSNGSYDTDGEIALSGTAEEGSTVEVFSRRTTSKGTTTASPEGSWTMQLTGVPDGSQAYTATATDTADNTSDPSDALTVIVDKIAPTVSSVTPADRATGVARGTSVKTKFSEAMDPATLNSSTVTLVKNGYTLPVAATLRYDEASRTVVLDPLLKLERKTKYKVTVKGGASGAKDLAGHPLAADKVWYFTTARR